jgi:hypothetical protein
MIYIGCLLELSVVQTAVLLIDLMACVFPLNFQAYYNLSVYPSNGERGSFTAVLRLLAAHLVGFQKLPGLGRPPDPMRVD